ncbi:hypothetical protein CHUAL_002826 [Chamberlinius hualienensis]
MSSLPPGVPSKPSNLRVVQVTNNMIKVEWEQPENPNGIIQGYRLYYMHKNYTDVRTLRNPEPKMEYMLTNLEPYRSYKIWLKAFTSRYEGEPSEMLTTWTDVEAPSQPQLVNVSCQSHDSIYLQWQRPHLYYNQVDYYYVYYRSEKSWDFQQLGVASPSNQEDHSLFLPNLTSYTMYEVKVRGATRSLVNKTHLYKGPFSEARKVVLHDRCSRELSSYPASLGPVDGASAGMIAGLVCASFTLFLAILALILWRKCFQATYYYLDDPPPKAAVSQLNMADIYEESEYPSVHVSLWGKHVGALHADGDIGFSKEYEAIQQATAAELLAEQSQTVENKPKNRYLNIVAYDHSRVILRPIPGQKKCPDYVNANYIDGYYRPRAYIGTQGPLPTTFGDFWRMVWEQRVVIIVMITNLIERGRVSQDTRKCDMYWPKEGIESHGFIQVRLAEETVLATYTVRTLILKNLKVRKKAQAERTVYQYHYTNWPDHGVPEHPLPVLSFVKKSAAANPDNAGPIIVHCSAGVGRTGTYIVLDAMLRQIKRSHDVNVFGFLKHIRSQRNYLVQTEEQYIFIHDALLEAIESSETEVPLPYLGRYLQSLQTSSADKSCNDGSMLTPINGEAGSPASNQISHHSWQLLDRQFKQVTTFVPKEFQMLSSTKPYNAAKIRQTYFVPLESHRVNITPKPGIEGSDYINATFLQGFYKLKEFVVTQHPLPDTTADFWQMIWDHNIQTVVLISPVDEQNWEPFWPTRDDPLITEVFTAKLTTETDYSFYQTKDFVMHSNQDDYELVCRMIYCPNWPHCCSPLSAVFDLVRVVQQWFADNQNGPVVVVDRFGGTEAATFCCLTTLSKQLEYENRVDVYQYSKLYHIRRPGIWRTQDDYLFLYRAMESLAGFNNLTAPSENHLVEARKSPTTTTTTGNGHLIIAPMTNISLRSSLVSTSSEQPLPPSLVIVSNPLASSPSSSPIVPSPTHSSSSVMLDRARGSPV